MKRVKVNKNNSCTRYNSSLQNDAARFKDVHTVNMQGRTVDA